jgi:HSP20 family molecular chaperone IbpA
METNLLRLTDKYDDPIAELRLAANAVGHATRRVIERAVDNGPLGDFARILFKPRIRVAEDSDTLVVTMEIPGAEKGSIEVTLSSKDILCIKGRGIKRTRARVKRENDGPPQVRSFERTVPLSGRALLRDKATAVLESGLMTVTIPKLAKALPAESEKRDIRAA